MGKERAGLRGRDYKRIQHMKKRMTTVANHPPSFPSAHARVEKKTNQHEKKVKCRIAHVPRKVDH